MWYFLLPLIVGVSIQLIKIILDFAEERTFSVNNFFRAGGFPSVHSGIASSIVTLMFMECGYNTAEFAITFTFAFLFWYDSMNVRYEAGKHAKYLNKISSQLKNALEFQDKNVFLKERLGHTFLEVIGGISIWILLTLFYYEVVSDYLFVWSLMC